MRRSRHHELGSAERHALRPGTGVRGRCVAATGGADPVGQAIAVQVAVHWLRARSHHDACGRRGNLDQADVDRVAGTGREHELARCHRVEAVVVCLAALCVHAEDGLAVDRDRQKAEGRRTGVVACRVLRAVPGKLGFAWQGLDRRCAPGRIQPCQYGQLRALLPGYAWLLVLVAIRRGPLGAEPSGEVLGKEQLLPAVVIDVGRRLEVRAAEAACACGGKQPAVAVQGRPADDLPLRQEVPRARPTGPEAHEIEPARLLHRRAGVGVRLAQRGVMKVRESIAIDIQPGGSGVLVGVLPVVAGHVGAEFLQLDLDGRRRRRAFPIDARAVPGAEPDRASLVRVGGPMELKVDDTVAVPVLYRDQSRIAVPGVEHAAVLDANARRRQGIRRKLDRRPHVARTGRRGVAIDEHDLAAESRVLVVVVAVAAGRLGVVVRACGHRCSLNDEVRQQIVVDVGEVDRRASVDLAHLLAGAACGPGDATAGDKRRGCRRGQRVGEGHVGVAARRSSGIEAPHDQAL